MLSVQLWLLVARQQQPTMVLLLLLAAAGSMLTLHGEWHAVLHTAAYGHKQLRKGH
jgi:hypothetical protein